METCQKSIYDNTSMRSRICDRPAKEDGLCGIHLAAKRRRQANEAKRRERDSVSESKRTRAEDALERLGIEGKADYATYPASGYTGKVIVDPDDIFALLERKATSDNDSQGE